MSYFNLVLILSLVVISFCLSYGQKTASVKVSRCQRIVCYLTFEGTRRTGIGALNVDKLNTKYCTHIIIGYVPIIRYKLQPLSAADKDVITKLKAIKKNTHKLLEILIAVEAGNDFSGMVNSRFERPKFIDSVVTYLRALDISGIDFAIVNPVIVKNDDYQKVKLSTLVMEMQKKFKDESLKTRKPKLLLVADVSANTGMSEQGFEALALSHFLDFVNIMTFNYHGAWDLYPGHNSPLHAHDNNAIDYSLDYWEKRGMKKGQINAAIAAFGRSYYVKETVPKVIIGPGPAGAYTKTEGFLSYYELCQAFKQNGEVYLDNYERAAYYKEDGHKAVSGFWITYENSASVRAKIQYIKERGFGGIVLYRLDFDDVTGQPCGQGAFPITRIVKEACGTII